MPDLVTLTIDGRQVQAKPGTLVIDAAKTVGIEIPSFCYWEGLTLQAACRMCLVEVEKMPKLQTACTLVVGEGMVVRSETPVIAAARKSTLEFLLANHPLDCPVCDKGGECELQDMAFRYGAGESRFSEVKHHVVEAQWSPVVYYDAPRCILCYRCIRICAEGIGVAALGLVNRTVNSEIAPNRGDHLECDECGACIDICPVGALTSGPYRYKTRPWEMTHVGTICTHCSNGCKTTLGVRNDHIIRANNRDRSGVNGEFLCIKGRFAWDFNQHPERLQSPLMRSHGKLEPVPWSRAIEAVAAKFKEDKERNGAPGIIGSNRTTNEENYYLRKFARQVLGTGNIDHRRTGDVTSLRAALQGKTGMPASTADLYEKKAILVIGADLAHQQPLLSYQIRAGFRHHQAHVYVVTEHEVREDKYSVESLRVGAGSPTPGYFQALDSLRDPLRAESELVIVFNDAIKGRDVDRLVEFGESLGIPVYYVALVDYCNSRGAIDMGLVPEPGGLTLPEMMAAGLDALWIVGANPGAGGREPGAGFLVVNDLFLTETAQAADVVFPAASAYEKNGTFTNVTGEVQRLRKAAQFMGAKADLEIIGLIAKEMGAAPVMGPWIAGKVFEEIRQTVPGYSIHPAILATGGAVHLPAVDGRGWEPRPDLVESARDLLFTSGTLGRYSKVLNSVIENPHRRP